MRRLHNSGKFGVEVAAATYDLDYSLDATAAKVQSRHGYKVGPLDRRVLACRAPINDNYARLRPEGRRLFSPAQTIRSIKLFHWQVYKFAYHRPKLAMLRKSEEHRRFAGVADFLELVPIDCPHELFRDGERASQTPLAKIRTSRLIVVENENFATRTAEAASRVLTGHIDLLQVRNGAVHILDYKTDARTNHL